MRFVWAVAAFVLAAVLIGAGIAQRTLFVGPSTTESTVVTSDGLPYTLIDGAVLTSMPGSQGANRTTTAGGKKRHLLQKPTRRTATRQQGRRPCATHPARRGDPHQGC